MKHLFLIFLIITCHWVAIGQKADGKQKTENRKQKTVSVDTIDYSYLKFDTLYHFYLSKGINIIKADNPDLYFEVFDWLNSPYCWGGKSKKGTDCAGFVSTLINKLYTQKLGGSAGDIFKKCDEVPVAELKEGDLLFFNIYGRSFYHVGIYLQNGKFAHAAVHGGVIISSLEEKYYKRWFYKAGRMKGE
jgi:hypothetical protein